MPTNIKEIRPYDRFKRKMLTDDIIIEFIDLYSDTWKKLCLIVGYKEAHKPAFRHACLKIFDRIPGRSEAGQIPKRLKEVRRTTFTFLQFNLYEELYNKRHPGFEKRLLNKLTK